MVKEGCFLPLKTQKALENQGLFVFVCKITAQNSFIVQKCSFDIYIPHIKNGNHLHAARTYY